ncbi:MAG: hypothetical protein ACP5NF_08010 [Thermoanaerobaculum sp.]
MLVSPKAQEQLRKGQALLASYRPAGADYVNFHWYIPDTRALGEAVAYLKAKTGLPVLTNEIGQTNDDPNQTTAVMGKVVRLGLPMAVWFSVDAPKARALVNPDGTLRPTGEAFKRFISAVCPQAGTLSPSRPTTAPPRAPGPRPAATSAFKGDRAKVRPCWLTIARSSVRAKHRGVAQRSLAIFRPLPS